MTLPPRDSIGVITGVETIRWSAQPNALWVLIHTSSGVTGLGETYYQPGAVEALVHEFAIDLLLGKEASRITQHWDNLFSCVNFYGFAGAELRMISAIDIALWDACGKYVQRPLYDLLGGKVRESIGIYNTCVSTPKFDDGRAFLESPAELAVDLAAAGFRGMKIWPWDQFAPQIDSAAITGPAGWSAMGPIGHHLTLEQIDRGIDVLRKIREAVGHGIEIIIEGHSRWDLNSAVRLSRALEPFEPMWAEDLIQPTNAQDLRSLTEASRVPVAASERLMSRFAYRDLFTLRAMDITMLDVAWTGGITEARRIADMASTYNLPVTLHDCTGPVTAFANLHLAVSLTNVNLTEVVRGFVDGYYQDVVDARLPVADGAGCPTTSPGLGVSLRPDFLERPDVTRRLSAL